MKKASLSRRNVLKGIAALPTVAALQGCDRLSHTGRPPTVNVILHGAYVLELNARKKKAFVHIPKVTGDNTCYDHVYLAGQWGLEQPLPETGDGPPVKISRLVGSDSLPDITNVKQKETVIRNRKFTPAAKPWTILELPLPKCLIPAHSAKLVDDSGQSLFFFQDKPEIKALIGEQPVQLATSLVLVYESLSRSCHPFVGDQCLPRFTNLHIFAEPMTDPDATHALNALHGVKNLFSELQPLDFNSAWCDSQNGCDNDYEQAVPEPLPSGVSCLETISSCCGCSRLVP